MPATSDELRDYLISILECEGASVAERRLKLRAEWRRTHKTGQAADVGLKSTTSDQAPADWSGLEKIWQTFDQLPVDPTSELRPWLESQDEEIRQAAERVVMVRAHRDQLAALWPKTIDQSLFAWWLDTVIRPDSRRRSLQQSLTLSLTATSATAKAFQRFVRTVQQRYPELNVTDLVATSKTDPLMQSFAATQSARPPAPKSTSENNRLNLVWFAVGIGAFSLRLLFGVADKRSETPRPVPSFNNPAPWTVPNVPPSQPNQWLQQLPPNASVPANNPVLVELNEWINDQANVDFHEQKRLKQQALEQAIPADAMRPQNLKGSEATP